MAKQKITVTKLLEEFQKTINARGMDATATLLQNGRQTTTNDDIIQFVIITVCNKFNLTIEHVMVEKTVKDDKTAYCRGFIVWYLRKNFKLGWTEIKPILKRDQSNLWRSMELIKNLRPKFPSHVEWLEYKRILDKLIDDYQS